MVMLGKLQYFAAKSDCLSVRSGRILCRLWRKAEVVAVITKQKLHFLDMPIHVSLAYLLDGYAQLYNMHSFTGGLERIIFTGTLSDLALTPVTDALLFQMQ